MRRKFQQFIIIFECNHLSCAQLELDSIFKNISNLERWQFHIQCYGKRRGGNILAYKNKKAGKIKNRTFLSLCDSLPNFEFSGIVHRVKINRPVLSS